jgi:hypothetical protein
MLLDIVETYIFNFATKQYPDHASSGVVHVASMQISYSGLHLASVHTVSLVALFVYNSLGEGAKSHKQ